jgi:hypothetical protein
VNSLSVKILLRKLAITVTVGSLLFSSPTVAQVLRQRKKPRASRQLSALFQIFNFL